MAMVEGRQRQEWEHTSTVCCFLFNALMRRQGEKASEPSRFNPFSEKAGREVIVKLDRRDSMTALKGVFGRMANGGSK